MDILFINKPNLYKMSYNPNQALVREAGGCTVVLDALIQHMEEPSIANRASRAIGAMAFDEESRKILVENGACELIIDTIQMYMENEDVLIPCCWCISVLANDPSALPIISEKMNSTLSEEEVSLVLSIISNISDYDPSNQS